MIKMTYDNPNKKPTPDQLNYLEILGYTGKIPKTRFQTTLLIADLLYHWRSREPTQDQINRLKKEGYKGQTPKTRGSASDLISDILHLKKSGINLNDIRDTIYGSKWSEENPFEHIHEHKPDFYKAKEWRDSLDN